jgi:hypothetical protein
VSRLTHQQTEWLRGYVALGHVTGDTTVQSTANQWISGIMATAASDGFFGPTELMTNYYAFLAKQPTSIHNNSANWVSSTLPTLHNVNVAQGSASPHSTRSTPATPPSSPRATTTHL